MTLRAAMRDASWHASPGEASRYHVIAEGGAPACSKRLKLRDARMTLANFTETDAADVDAMLRCRRNGCRQRWPAVSS